MPETPPELQGAQPRIASIVVVPSPRSHGASSTSRNGSSADAGRDVEKTGEGWKLVSYRRGPCPPPLLLKPPLDDLSLCGSTEGAAAASSQVTVPRLAGIPSDAPVASSPATVLTATPTLGARSVL